MSQQGGVSIGQKIAAVMMLLNAGLNLYAMTTVESSSILLFVSPVTSSNLASGVFFELSDPLSLLLDFFRCVLGIALDIV